MQRQGEKGTVGGHVGPPGASGGKFTPTTLLGWCPSIYVINRVRIREQLLYLIQFIQECHWDTIAQQLSRRPDSIRHARSHGWRDGLPAARCPATARRFRRREALAQALMRQAKMIVTNGVGLIHTSQSATSGKAGGLKKVEPLKADRCCEPLKAVRL